MKWHSFIERIAPLGTRRRRWYDLGIKGLRILVNEGFSSFLYKFKQYRVLRRPPRMEQGQQLPISAFEKYQPDNEEVIDTKVSIIIPTKNAGDDFEYTLEKIRCQRGIKEIEIIIVDSGSTDNTLNIAEKYGAKIFRITPEEFSHSRTRNFAAEKATGEYLVFITQDAIPVGEYWLYNMIKVFNLDNKIAAVTCRQIPRSDADIFACYSLWNHYTTLGLTEDKILEAKENFKRLSYIEKRSICQLDSVCCAVKRQIFQEIGGFNEELNYAEDLEFGKRLISAGYKIAFLYSNAVIHSHNRTALYFFKRSFVDTSALMRIFEENKGEIASIPKSSLEEFLTSIFAIYQTIQYYKSDIINAFSNIYLEDLVLIIRKNGIKLDSSTYDELSELLSKIIDRLKNKKRIRINEKIVDLILFRLESQLKHIDEYIEKTGSTITPDVAISCMCKVFAVIAGSSLACLISDESDEDSKVIKELLGEGV